MSARYRHPNSLVPTSFHNPFLVNLVAQRVSVAMATYIARQFIDVIRYDCADTRTALTSIPSRARLALVEEPKSADVASLGHFILHLTKYSGIQTATLLSTLIYLERLRVMIAAGTARDMPSTRHRVFLATLIVSAKYLNDSSPKNAHWSLYAGVFNLTEINLIERQLICQLDYDFRFDEQEALTVWAPLMPRMASQLQRDVRTRAFAVDKVTRASKLRSQRLPPSPPSEDEFINVERKMSNIHLSVASASSSMSSIASRNAPSLRSNASSEMGSLIDDNGSSSSSSEWMSSSEDEASDLEPEPEILHNGLKKFVLRPVPVYGYRNPYARTTDRARMPSDASTIMDLSPVARFRRSSAANGKRSNSVSYAQADSESAMAASTTLPSIPLSSSKTSFLSRMWGAATNKDVRGPIEIADSSNTTGGSAFRRLVLSHSRTNVRQGSLDV